jgi:hypothetical protein
VNTVLPKCIGISTSTRSFSLEGEGWDEGDITALFYSPHPSPPAGEGAYGYCNPFFIVHNSCVDVIIQSPSLKKRG